MDGAALTLTSSKKEHRDDELLTHAPSGDVGFQHRKEATRLLPRGDLIKGSGRTFDGTAYIVPSELVTRK
jgi:hypothetical protein